MEKDLDYYLNLPYGIEIQPIPKQEGGGFMAQLPKFGELGIVGDGDTCEDRQHYDPFHYVPVTQTRRFRFPQTKSLRPQIQDDSKKEDFQRYCRAYRRTPCPSRT